MIRVDTAFILDYMPAHEQLCNKFKATITSSINFKNQQEQNFYDFIRNNFARIIKMNKNEMLAFIGEINRSHPIVYAAAKRIKQIESRSGYQNNSYKNERQNEINEILRSSGCPPVSLKTVAEMKKEACNIIKQNFREKEMFEVIRALFNYDSFRDRHGTEFIANSKLEACPYCNRAFIAIYNDGTSFTADIDHYFPRSKYPFFGLTLYNLIPSCSLCNERLKLAKDFLENEHLYPYSEDSENRVCFKIRSEERNLDFNDKSSFSILVTPKDTSDIIASASIDTFRLNDLYQFHKQTVIRMARIKRINTPEIRDEIKRLLKLRSDSEINYYFNDLCFWTGKEGILSKFIRDISDELDKKFGIIRCSDPTYAD